MQIATRRLQSKPQNLNLKTYDSHPKHNNQKGMQVSESRSTLETLGLNYGTYNLGVKWDPNFRNDPYADYERIFVRPSFAIIRACCEKLPYVNMAELQLQ